MIEPGGDEQTHPDGDRFATSDPQGTPPLPCEPADADGVYPRALEAIRRKPLVCGLPEVLGQVVMGREVHCQGVAGDVKLRKAETQDTIGDPISRSSLFDHACQSALV